MAFSYPPSVGSFVGGAGATPFKPVADKVFFPRTSVQEAALYLNAAVAPIMFTENTNIDGLCFRVAATSTTAAGATGWEARLFIYESDSTTGLPSDLLIGTSRYEVQPSDEEFLDDGTTPNPADGVDSLGVTITIASTQLDANKLYWVGAAYQYMASPSGATMNFDCNLGTGTNPLADYGLDTSVLEFYTTASGLYLGEVVTALTGANDFTDTLPATITATEPTGINLKVGVKVEA